MMMIDDDYAPSQLTCLSLFFLLHLAIAYIEKLSVHLLCEQSDYILLFNSQVCQDYNSEKFALALDNGPVKTYYDSLGKNYQFLYSGSATGVKSKR